MIGFCQILQPFNTDCGKAALSYYPSGSSPHKKGTKDNLGIIFM